MAAVAIHLVERLTNFQLVNKETHEWESGFWTASLDSAKKLLGGNIYLHKGQLEPSFCGGEITGVRVAQHKERAGGTRVVFRFRRKASCKGVTTAKAGWGNEQKRIGI